MNQLPDKLYDSIIHGIEQWDNASENEFKSLHRSIINVP